VGHYLALLGLILRDEPDASVILIGGPLERDLNAQLLNADPRFIDGGTHSSVGYVAALLAAADWVLTPDSLCYHLATAVGTPAVCLVGPTAPWELDRYDANLVLHDDRDCIACYRATCPLSETCMDSLSAGHVWSAIQQSIDYSADQFQMRSAVLALDTQAQERLGALRVRSVA
jgi:ADP-heptose:LPS heptosyltransferase